MPKRTQDQINHRKALKWEGAVQHATDWRRKLKTSPVQYALVKRWGVDRQGFGVITGYDGEMSDEHIFYKSRRLANRAAIAWNYAAYGAEGYDSGSGDTHMVVLDTHDWREHFPEITLTDDIPY